MLIKNKNNKKKQHVNRNKSQNRPNLKRLWLGYTVKKLLA